jgi:DNA-binding GntR family transcriptional regulator
LAKVIGTSRFPVHVALLHLLELGIVRHDRNRGFFLTVPASSLSKVAQVWSTAADNPLYLKIADLRLRGKLSDIVNESELIRLFDDSRNVIRKTLLRIQQEGWVERRAGHGWLFLPMIDSVEAYEESYIFRLAIEPAGIACATFRPDLRELEASRTQQQTIASGGYRIMTPIERFEANARFHETVGRWSHNRFIWQSIRRHDQLRRLVQYRHWEKRHYRKGRTEDHLLILDSIAKGDFLTAAIQMRKHLQDSMKGNVSSNFFYKKRSGLVTLPMIGGAEHEKNEPGPIDTQKP